VAGVLASLDVLVSASRSEAFGIVLAEAMASGLPVVATATEGAREIVEEGRTGLVVPVDDVDSLAAALSDLLGDEPRRRALGERGRQTAAERFSLERMVADTERVYGEALGL
jgi:glycosyltransferase involved in cell wall biosynthesis